MAWKEIENPMKFYVNLRFFPSLFVWLVILLVVFIHPPSSGVAALSTPTPLSPLSSPSGTINVYDNVLPKSTCTTLHEAASRAGLGHKVFKRPLTDRTNRPVIEQALDSILSKLGDEDINDDNEQYVEYWTRQEWRHIEAHADVDEHLAKEQDGEIAKGNRGVDDDFSFRYPDNGHVLYLKIGTEVRGPTCIFPQVRCIFTFGVCAFCYV